MQYWENTAREIVEYSHGDKIILEKSTLHVRIAAALNKILNANDKGIHFEVISDPE